MYHRYISFCIRLIADTFHKICMHQTYFISREKAEILLRRINHKIITLNVKFTSKRHFSHTKFRILQIVLYIQIFHFSFRIVVDHQFDWIQDCHHTRLLHLQIFTDTILQHCIIHRALALGYSAHFNEHLNGFRCKSSSSESCDRYKSRIIPSVYNTIHNKLLDVSLTCNNIRQIQLWEFNLSRCRIKFTLFYNPVI